MATRPRSGRGLPAPDHGSGPAVCGTGRGDVPDVSGGPGGVARSGQDRTRMAGVPVRPGDHGNDPGARQDRARPIRTGPGPIRTARRTSVAACAASSFLLAGQPLARAEHGLQGILHLRRGKEQQLVVSLKRVIAAGRDRVVSVSYTHLTLPTILRV